MKPIDVNKAVTWTMNVIMSLCMSITALLVNRGVITLPSFALTFVESLIICSLATIILHVPGICRRGAMALARGRDKGVVFFIAMNLFAGTANTLVMHTSMTFINVGTGPRYWAAWLYGFPILELVSVIVTFIFSPLAGYVFAAINKKRVEKVTI